MLQKELKKLCGMFGVKIINMILNAKINQGNIKIR
jgi:hypothetical protein